MPNTVRRTRLGTKSFGGRKCYIVRPRRLRTIRAAMHQERILPLLPHRCVSRSPILLLALLLSTAVRRPYLAKVIDFSPLQANRASSQLSSPCHDLRACASRAYSLEALSLSFFLESKECCSSVSRYALSLSKSARGTI